MRGEGGRELTSNTFANGPSSQFSSLVVSRWAMDLEKDGLCDVDA